MSQTIRHNYNKTVQDITKENSIRWSDEVITQAVDNIAVSVSAGLAEIRVLLQNKRRCRNIEENTIIKLQNTVSVYLKGVEINPRTRNSKGFCCIIWNKEHTLNVCFYNHWESCWKIPAICISAMCNSPYLQTAF